MQDATKPSCRECQSHSSLLACVITVPLPNNVKMYNYLFNKNVLSRSCQPLGVWWCKSTLKARRCTYKKCSLHISWSVNSDTETCLLKSSLTYYNIKNCNAICCKNTLEYLKVKYPELNWIPRTIWKTLWATVFEQVFWNQTARQMKLVTNLKQHDAFNHSVHWNNKQWWGEIKRNIIGAY